MKKLLILLTLLLLLSGGVLAQETTPEAEPITYPVSYLMDGFTHHPQGWNNCGPATITMALTYYGYTDNQNRAAAWLKPNGEDKNVSPWQMVEFVNTQVPEIPVFALQRYGGTLETLKMLLTNEFPVIIEAGYDPPRAAQGWMGHYLLVIGYDDNRQIITTHDSYDGPFMEYTYEHIEEFWQHFNYTYLVLYSAEREAELMALLGDDADETNNLLNAFEIARSEAIADPNDSFAWFNMGSILVELSMYEDATTAYNQARSVGDGLPWRMLWYQFGMYEAYLETGNYEEVITLASNTRSDGGGQYVEETFYYAGRAREGLGENSRAIENYQAVLAFNPNFEPARERLSALRGS
ncbi:MAG: hypothetical protein OHK0046_36060 [Anaerolineae bacterium]